eukprot:TRINITY_DN74398_c0_g1_i1.p1 TRINITY_DN74398_c0_g1~~TRINITY_DN74398_c0_g1_i1.p1  ORF type:complete len:632 (+),score=159.38 TRINITY_DN74398_c0_g1_i1:97-1992(+)
MDGAPGTWKYPAGAQASAPSAASTSAAKGGYGPIRSSDASAASAPRTNSPYSPTATGAETFAAGGKEALTLRLKCMQRVDANARTGWQAFCRSRGQRNFDPRSASEEMLIEFFDAFVAGDLDDLCRAPAQGQLPLPPAPLAPPPLAPPLGPPPLGPPSTPPPDSAQVAGDPAAQVQALLEAQQLQMAALQQHQLQLSLSQLSYGDKPAMVAKIKELQRSNADARQRWLVFCETHGSKKHDPNAHEATFLATFLQALASGILPTVAPQMTARDYLAAGKDALVGRVKEIQRTEHVAKHQWVAYCEGAGHRKHDPKVHDESFLFGFLQSLEAGSLPLPVAGSAPQQSKQNLSARISRIRHEEPEGNEQWISYCESHGFPKHDPKLHEDSFLATFLEAWESGNVSSVMSGKAVAVGKAALVGKIKSMQRVDPVAKQQWITYCEKHNQKKHDPNQHDEAFLRAFFEARERGLVPEDTTGKVILVQRVKEIQRKTPNGKQAWTDFCTSQGSEKHDPNLYEPAVLSKFVQDFEMGNVPMQTPSEQQALFQQHAQAAATLEQQMQFAGAVAGLQQYPQMQFDMSQFFGMPGQLPFGALPGTLPCAAAGFAMEQQMPAVTADMQLGLQVMQQAAAGHER